MRQAVCWVADLFEGLRGSTRETRPLGFRFQLSHKPAATSPLGSSENTWHCYLRLIFPIGMTVIQFSALRWRPNHCKILNRAASKRLVRFNPLAQLPSQAALPPPFELVLGRTSSSPCQYSVILRNPRSACCRLCSLGHYAIAARSCPCVSGPGIHASRPTNTKRWIVA